MKKATRTMTCVFIAALLTFTTVGLCACGDRKVSGTYKIEYDKEYVSTHMSEFEGGAQSFLTMGEGVSFNELTLKEDGTYSYVKDLRMPAFSMALTITYEGSYVNGKTAYNDTKDNSYILRKPTAAAWTLTPGMTCMAGWGDGVSHGVADMAEFGAKEYTGTLADEVYLGIESTAIIDYFLGATLLFKSTEDMADTDICIEVAIDDTAKTIVYLPTA